jgi:DNA repair protein RadC
MEEEVKELTGIKSWAEEDRPREKLLEKGRSVLSEAELIAILLGSGSRNETAVELARKILKSVDNNLHELGKLTVSDLKKFKGMGEAKAVSVIAALELGRRRKNSETPERAKITASKDVFHLFEHLGDLPHEEFWVAFLNRSNKVLSTKSISAGGISGTVADSRIIFKEAIERLASAIILCHNHPSGNLKPSDADISLTKKLSEAGKLLDVPVLDHIIVAGTAYYSFADEGNIL